MNKKKNVSSNKSYVYKKEYMNDFKNHIEKINKVYNEYLKKNIEE